ncbi:MAG: endonuclease NucS [Candidatus Omnitrophota bacterium]|nr:endonuclease NucS [Candidatus Omnitrophota bacterium]
MAEFKFTPEQIENLRLWKNSLSSEEAKNWYEEEAKAEIQTRAILNSEDFKQGKDLTPEKLDDLFGYMKHFSANRNLTNLLYKNNSIEEFNKELRNLIHGTDSFPSRVNNFFRLKGIGIQTLSQFLVSSDPSKYPFVTSQTKEAIQINSEQDQAALKDATQIFNITDKEELLERTLDYLRDCVIFQAIKELLGLEKYNLVNNLLWFAFAQGEEGPEEAMKSYGSISIENDLRDYLTENIFILEKGFSLVGKEYDTREVGKIDLLCKDKQGNHVVVELKKGRENDKVVGQTLRYVGWVKRNFNTKVRGIIIVNEPDERLSYAVEPLNGLIKLKFYKVNFEIKDSF